MYKRQHLGRWYRLGSGVPIDLELSEQWYQKAVDLNDGKGHTGLGRLCWKSNPNKAAAHFKMAVSMGELNAYSHLADLDRANELEHLLNALQTNEAYADYAYGHYLIRESKSEEEKARHIHWIEKAAKKGMASARSWWPCTTSKAKWVLMKTSKLPKNGAAWVATPAT